MALDAGQALERIVKKQCGPPIRRNGSHRRYQGIPSSSPSPYHDGDDVTGNKVRRVLIEDVGLAEDEAREEVS